MREAGKEQPKKKIGRETEKPKEKAVEPVIVVSEGCRAVKEDRD